MEKELLKEKVTELLPSSVFDETGEWLNVTVDAVDFKLFAYKLRHEPALFFDYLFNLTCVDWKTNLTMVYHLTSTHDRNRTLVVKVKLDPVKPVIDTVSDIWRTAEFHEREVYDLFGVHFTNHPDLRRILLPDDWTGWPLRKDYSDPVNMIKL